MSQDLHKLARNVDAVVPILFWEPTEFAIAVALMGFGMLANAWIIGACGGAFVLWGAGKLKRGAKTGAVHHWIWSKGLPLDPALLKRFPSPSVNDFFE